MDDEIKAYNVDLFYGDFEGIDMEFFYSKKYTNEKTGESFIFYLN